jgi:16S rRNA (uracil1498-N3)-methyltransferase
MVEKTTELGVAHIIPLVTARTIKTQVIMTRLQKIIHEATEQSERGVVSVLHQPILFSECLSSVSPSACAILFDISGKYISNITFNPACISQDKKEINLYIGPEGGWAEEELHQAQQKEIEIGSLGNTILRTETAALTSCFWASRMLE